MVDLSTSVTITSCRNVHELANGDAHAFCACKTLAAIALARQGIAQLRFVICRRRDGSLGGQLRLVERHDQIELV